MNTLDVMVHKHFGTWSQANVGSQYRGYHLINIHSVSMYFTFKNVYGTAAQRTLTITETPNTIVIPQGAYSLNTLNKYLLEAAGAIGPFVKVWMAKDGISGYEIKKYLTKADLQSDTNGIVQNVGAASELNLRLKNKTLFCERIKLWSSIIRGATNPTTDGS